MSNDIYTVATVFETKGQAEAEKALRDNEAATKAYEKATQTLNSRMKVSVDQSNKKAKTLGQLDSATKKAENEIKRLSVSVQQGAITGGQYQGRLNQIAASLKKMGLENAQSRVLSYGRATREATATVKQHEAALKAKAIAQGRTTTSTTRLTQATGNATSAQQRARQQFLATANSIAVLDGPLGGVASRFSAFGVLIGRIGIPLASLSIAMTALGVITGRTVRNFMEFEAQTNRIDAVLRATNNTFGTTSAEVNSMAASIALATLESEDNVRSAATQLLTFRNVTVGVFEDVLKSAADLAALGFGTIESETVKLAKALEDPRQGLTSLSRAGVTFTRQQRALIISLIETGDRARAMELILANVNKQVGGAAEAAARDTLAGDFDTIGQATNRAARGVGSFLGEMVRLVSSPAAKALADFAAGPGTEREQLKAIEEVISAYEAQFKSVRPLVDAIEELESNVENLSARQREELSVLRNLYNEQVAYLGITDNINAALTERARLSYEIAQVEREAAIAELDRRVSSVDGLLEEISMRERLIGLTDTQARNIRLLADAELLQADINDIIRDRTDLLIAQGVPAAQAIRQAEALRSELEGITIESLNALSAREEMTRQAIRIADGVANENELLQTQLVYINEGYTATVARRMALIDQERQILENTIKENELAIAVLNTNSYTAEGIKNLEEQARLRQLNLDLEAAIVGLEQREVLTREIADASRPSGRGGGGGGSDPNAEFQRELEALQSYLEQRREEMMIARGFEREIILEQYEERHEALRNALDRELVTRQEYDDLELQLAISKAEKLAEIERSANSQRLSDMAGFYGALAGIAQSGGDRMVKVVAAFSGIQATINAWNAYTAALASPVPMTPWARMALAAKVLSAGLGAVRNIASAGGGSGGGSSAVASPRTADAPREAREAAPQRVLIQGIDPSALYTGEQLQNLFDAFQDENKNRGQIFLVSS